MTQTSTQDHTHTQSASLTSWIIWTAYISPAPDLNGTWVIFAFGQIVQDEWIDTCDTENMSRPAVTDWLTWAMWLKGVCAYGESRWRGGGPVAEVTDLRKEKTKTKKEKKKERQNRGDWQKKSKREQEGKKRKGSEGSPGYIGSWVCVCACHMFLNRMHMAPKGCIVSIQTCPNHTSKSIDVTPHQTNTLSTWLKQIYFQGVWELWSDTTTSVTRHRGSQGCF